MGTSVTRRSFLGAAVVGGAASRLPPEGLAAIKCRSRPSHSSYVAPTRVRAWPRAGRRMNSGSFGLKCGETRYNKSEQTREN
jgi:hypothetical protein